MRTLSVLLLVLGLASSTGLSPYLGQLYANTRPTSPDPSAGRVYVHQVRGAPDVYVSRSEHWAVFGSFAGGGLMAVLGAALFLRSTRRHAGAA